MTSHCALGRKLSCDYDHYIDLSVDFTFSSFNYCYLNSVDLSEKFQSQNHSFSGTSEQKLAVTMVWFEKSKNIDFLPKEISQEFPNLSGMQFSNGSFPIVRSDFFRKDFVAVIHLNLGYNKIQTIEDKAFQHLTKLKWIRLRNNQIQSLPFHIFKNNSELIYVDLRWNKINSITPDFFKNLKNLKFAEFNNNQCVDKNFGCSLKTCSVSQAVLDKGLSDCYLNCLKDLECAFKSGKFAEQMIEAETKRQAMEVELKELKKEIAELKTRSGMKDYY
jgi:hypothetical protein